MIWGNEYPMRTTKAMLQVIGFIPLPCLGVEHMEELGVVDMYLGGTQADDWT